MNREKCYCENCHAKRVKRYLDLWNATDARAKRRTAMSFGFDPASKDGDKAAFMQARVDSNGNFVIEDISLKPGAINLAKVDYAKLEEQIYAMLPPTLEWRKPMCFTSKTEMKKKIEEQEALISAKSKRITELEYRLRDANVRADRWKDNTMQLGAAVNTAPHPYSRERAEILRKQLDDANAELQNRDKSFLRMASAKIAGHIAAAGAVYNKGDDGKTLGRVIAEQSYGLASELLDVHKGVPAKITLPEKDFTLAEITAIVNGDKVLSDPEREQYNNFLQRKKGKANEPEQSDSE